MTKFLLITMMAASTGACGKDKPSEPAAAEPAGPPCTAAAAAYVKNLLDGGGNELAAMKPTPEQVKEVTAKLEASCNAGWTGTTRACVVKAGAMELGTCWKDAMERATVAQIVTDHVKAAKP